MPSAPPDAAPNAPAAAHEPSEAPTPRFRRVLVRVLLVQLAALALLALLQRAFTP